MSSGPGPLCCHATRTAAQSSRPHDYNSTCNVLPSNNPYCSVQPGKCNCSKCQHWGPRCDRSKRAHSTPLKTAWGSLGHLSCGVSWGPNGTWANEGQTLFFKQTTVKYLWSIMKSKLSSKNTKILENIYPSFHSEQHGIKGTHSSPAPWREGRNSDLQTEQQARGG